MARDDAHLLDVLKAARLAIEFKGRADKMAFLGDAKTQSAVLHQLLIVGEAVRRISSQFRAPHPEVPWKLIAGTRDKLIHFYDGVDLNEVWSMVISDLPKPIHLIEPLIPDTPRMSLGSYELAFGLVATLQAATSKTEPSRTGTQSAFC